MVRGYGAHPTDTPARQAFREAVQTVAAQAKAALPDCHGRIDKAVALVLAGDVQINADGSATVGSQTSTRTYQTNGACDCTDYQKAPEGRCKHRLARWITKKATTLAREQVQALDQPTWPEQAKAQPELTPEPIKDDNVSVLIPAWALVTIKGKQFITYGGLLAMAHAKGL